MNTNWKRLLYFEEWVTMNVRLTLYPQEDHLEEPRKISGSYTER